MTGVRTETKFNTPEQVREYVRETLAVLEECEVPDDLRAIAFPSVMALVSGKNIEFAQAALAPPLMNIPRGV